MPSPAADVNEIEGFASSSSFCVECDYDLRGLAPDAVCPECGCPGHRTQMHLVCDWAPANRRRIARGAKLTSIACVLLAVWLLGYVAVLWGDAIPSWWIVVLPLTIPMLMLAIGWRQLSRLPRADKSTSRANRRTCRRLLRNAATVLIAGLAWLGVKLVWDTQISFEAESTLWIIAITATAVGVAFGQVRSLRVAALIAMRLRSRRLIILTKCARFIAIAGGLTFLGVAASPFLGLLWMPDRTIDIYFSTLAGVLAASFLATMLVMASIAFLIRAAAPRPAENPTGDQ